MSKPLQVGSTKRKPRKLPNSSEAETLDLLVALGETEGLLSLSSGAITSSAVRGSPVAATDGATLRGWEHKIPASAVRALKEAAEFGGVVAFHVRVNRTAVRRGHELRVELPISLSNIIGGVVENTDYLELLRARLSAFPDVVLDAVELRADSNCFEESVAEVELFPSRNVESPRLPIDAASGGRQDDKFSGAIAGLLAGLRLTGNWSSEQLSAIWASVGSVEGQADSLGSMVARIGDALSLERSDQVGLAFLSSLVRRLEKIGTKQGFQPDALLEEIAVEAREKCDAKQAKVLDRFVGTAKSVIAFESGAPKDILQDTGSIVLRGCLTFLQNPSVKRLESALAKGSRVGPKVGTLALTLCGLYIGTAALPRRLKAEPMTLLFALGDVTAAVAHGHPVVAASGSEFNGMGRYWVARLQGRDVGTFEAALEAPLQAVAEMVRTNGWVLSPSDAGVGFAIQGDTPQSFFASMSMGAPLEPRDETLLIDSKIGSGPDNKLTAAVIEAAMIISTKLAIGLYAKGQKKARTMHVGVYLRPEDVTAVTVEVGVARLRQALEEIITSMKSTSSKQRTTKQSKEAGHNGDTPAVLPTES